MKIATESDAFGSSLDHTSSGTSKTSISIASVMQDLKEKFKNDEDDRGTRIQRLYPDQIIPIIYVISVSISGTR